MRLLFLLPALAVALTTAASAQTTIVVKPGERAPAPGAAQQVRVSVGVNMFVPAPEETGEQALKAQEGGRRMIYEIAGHECALLEDVLASECHLESLNVNVQHAPGNQFGGQQRPEGFNINGNIGLRIVPK